MAEGMRFEDLKVGQRVKVKGKLDGNGRLVAQEVKVKPYEDEASVLGQIQTVDPHRKTVRVLNRELPMPEGISVKGLSEPMPNWQSLKAGDWIKVKGAYVSSGRFEPEKITMKDALADLPEELRGPIDRIDQSGKTLEVLGCTVATTQE